MVKLSEEDFEILTICAERYALGRRTYMPELVCKIIKGHIGSLSAKTIGALIQDIEHPYGGYGDDCDKKDWMGLLQHLKIEMKNKNAL